jgi:hypothetical protein
MLADEVNNAMSTSARLPEHVRKLPPLILHPFSDAHAPEKLTLSARASLILNGLVPPEEVNEEELNRRVLEGRYSEIKMLFYLGKDVERWMEQCMEVVARDAGLHDRGIEPESFAELLIEDAPAAVREKLHGWGVVDYRAIFRRALAVRSLFAAVPEMPALAPGFLRSHHRYADCIYKCRLEGVNCAKLNSAEFRFDVFASGEYVRLLEKEWGADGCAT